MQSWAQKRVANTEANSKLSLFLSDKFQVDNALYM